MSIYLSIYLSIYIYNTDSDIDFIELIQMMEMDT